MFGVTAVVLGLAWAWAPLGVIVLGLLCIGASAFSHACDFVDVDVDEDAADVEAAKAALAEPKTIRWEDLKVELGLSTTEAIAEARRQNTARLHSEGTPERDGEEDSPTQANP
jgi:hypothetical protein